MALSGLAKMLRATDERRTRLHTERGEILPILAVPSALRSCIQRGRGTQTADTPWIAPSAIQALDALITRSWAVLELGSGGSTSWLARRAGAVTSLEADPRWAEQTRTALAQAHLQNTSVIQMSVDDIPADLEQWEHETVDLVIIDCHETAAVTRLDCLRAAAPLVRPGRYLVLDDSDRRHLREADNLLTGWIARRHIGIKQFPLMAIETTIFAKPSG